MVFAGCRVVTLPAWALNIFAAANVHVVMTSKRTYDPMLWSSVVLALLVAATAVVGIWWPAAYARETPYSRAGAVGSDLVDLFVVAPVLLISGIKGYRGSIPARLVWLGAQGYLFYNFVIYAFAVHFNALVLLYCATLSLCFYSTVLALPFIPIGQIAAACAPRAPRKTVAITFIVLVLSTAVFDLLEDVAAIAAGRIPQSIVVLNQPVNFVHVLDLAFLLPGLCITAVFLLRRKAAGYALAPVMLALLAIMSVELASIVAMMGRAGFGMNFTMIGSFMVLGVAFTALLGFYLARANGSAWIGLDRLHS